MSNPFVTVVIPAYNHEKYIRDAIESVLQQDCKDWELIVINDGSTDDTGKVVDHFKNKKKVRVYHQDNIGLSATLNKALEKAKGKYFNFLPSDDYFHPSKLSNQLAVLNRDSDSDVVYCDQEIVDSSGNVSNDADILAWSNVGYETAEEILPNLFERNFIPAPSALVKTDSLREVGGFDESLIYTQDYDLWLRLLPGRKAFWLHKPLLFYRWHGENLTYQAKEPIHFERAYLLTKALLTLKIEDVFPVILKSGKKESKIKELQSFYYIKLTDLLIKSGLIEMLPFCRLFITKARELNPAVVVPPYLLEKIEKRSSFMDLRDSRLVELSKSLALAEGKLAEFTVQAESAAKLIEIKEELERYRVQVPDLHEKEKNLLQRKMELDETYRNLQRHQSEIEITEKNLQSLRSGLDKREKYLREWQESLGETDKNLLLLKTELDTTNKNLQQRAAEFEQANSNLLHRQAEVDGIYKTMQTRQAELDKWDKDLTVRSAELDKWNRDLDEKHEWLKGYNKDLDSRYLEMQSFYKRKTLRLLKRLFFLTDSIKPGITAFLLKLWRFLPADLRARYGPRLKLWMLRQIPDRKQDVALLPGKSSLTGIDKNKATPLSRVHELPSTWSYREIFNEPPLVSVILPVYNHASSVRTAVESILNQTYPNLEIIVVNDGSTDNLEDVLAPYWDRPNITILNQPNQKLPKALTNGFRFANGAFYTWTSADNIMLPWQLDYLVSFLSSNPEVDMTYGNVEIIDEAGIPFLDSNYRIHNQEPRGSSCLNLPGEVRSLDAIADNFINAAFLYRGEVGQALGPYDPRLLGTEDYDYWLRIKELFQIRKIDSDDILYQYRVHKNSLSEKYGASHIVHNVKKLIGLHCERKSFYKKAFAVFILRKTSLTADDLLIYWFAKGLKDRACDFAVVVSQRNISEDFVLPHISLENCKDAIESCGYDKIVILSEHNDLFKDLVPLMKDKDLWLGLLSSNEDLSKVKNSNNIVRKIFFNNPSDSFEPLAKENSLFLPSPLPDFPLFLKAREDSFPVWQFPWRGGPVALFLGDLATLNFKLVKEILNQFQDLDFVFAPPFDVGSKDFKNLSDCSNAYLVEFKNDEELYPLLGEVTFLWMPVDCIDKEEVQKNYSIALHASKCFIVSGGYRYSALAPYFFTFDSLVTAHDKIQKAIGLDVETDICDSFLKKFSPEGLADYLLSTANNDLFIQKECGGREGFSAMLPQKCVTRAERKKIAIEMNSMDKGGMEEVVFNLSSQADKRSFEIEIICMEKGGLLAGLARNDGIKVIEFNGEKQKYEDYLKKGNISLINGHYSGVGLQFAKKFNIPFISTIHNAYVWFEKASRDKFSKDDHFVTHYIAVSSSVKSYLIEALGISEEKITVVPNGVDCVRLDLLRRISPEITRETLGLSNEDFVFLNVGSMDGRKNHHAMISAMEKVVGKYPNARIVCAGNVMDPIYNERVMERVSELKLEKQIIFPGFINEVQDLYRMADCFLMPSIVEGWSIAKTEALFFGLPLLLTDVGGARDVMTEEWVGILVPNSFGEINKLVGENLGLFTQEENPSNLDALIRAMEDMIERKDYWASNSGSRTALAKERYSLEKMVKNTQEVFDRFLS